MQIANDPALKTEENSENNNKIKEFFKKLAGEDLEVDWIELKQLLDFAMKDGKTTCVLLRCVRKNLDLKQPE